RFLELHRARWSVEGGSYGLSDERHEAFHRAAVQQLAERGWLRLYTLFAARRPVASVYGVVQQGKFLYYQSGYDPAWGGKSVGLAGLRRARRLLHAPRPEGMGRWEEALRAVRDAAD